MNSSKNLSHKINIHCVGWLLLFKFIRVQISHFPRPVFKITTDICILDLNRIIEEAIPVSSYLDHASSRLLSLFIEMVHHHLVTVRVWPGIRLKMVKVL